MTSRQRLTLCALIAGAVVPVSLAWVCAPPAPHPLRGGGAEEHGPGGQNAANRPCRATAVDSAGWLWADTEWARALVGCVQASVDACRLGVLPLGPASRPALVGADYYVPRLKPILRRNNIPDQLVWLAEVESAFDPNACSSSGAVGLFQLMPNTAKQMGLSLAPYDERLHPEKSAEAAAKYLRSLFEYFGSWPLALAAYNAGVGKVDGLLLAYNGHSFGDIARYLPSETQQYVPKVNAVLLKHEGVGVSRLQAPL